MLSRATRASLITVAIGATAVLTAGCAGTGGSPAGGAANGAAKGGVTAQPTPQQAILLAATKTSQVNTIAANFTLQGTTPSGSVSAVGSIQEQLHPSLLVSANFSSLTGAGQSIPGGLAEVLTTKAVYLRLASITQALHTTKPWVEVPLTGSAMGSTLSSLLSDAQSSSPVTQTQMLGGATNVRKVGTSVIGGVPVTEYEGSVPFSQALAKLPANVRSSISSMASSTGIKTVNFKIWLDAQQEPKKVIITETGTSVSETITESDIVINQPVSISLPTAGQTYVLPASVLNGASTN